MDKAIKLAQEAIKTSEIQQIARILSKHNLGICVPHMHEEETGEIIPLPNGVISCERNLKVSFADENSEADQGVVPIAWRWNKTGIEICANCCITPGEG